MEKGENKIVNVLMRFLPLYVKDDIELYVSDSLNKEYITFNSSDEVNNIFSNLILEFLSSLSEEELLNLRSYTGYNFKNINAILRNNWTYEENGMLNDDIRKKFIFLSEKIKATINKFPQINMDFVVYRGTDISSFKEYGIDDINDLLNLKGKYIYEQGFTSTSMLESECYYDKKLENGINYNIEIKYLIGSECCDGALLLNNELSYSTNQYEYLINKNALSKVVDVYVDNVNNKAILTFVLIPSKKWNIENENEMRRSM